MQQTYVCITCFLNLNFTATTLTARLWQACHGTIDKVMSLFSTSDKI